MGASFVETKCFLLCPRMASTGQAWRKKNGRNHNRCRFPFCHISNKGKINWEVTNANAFWHRRFIFRKNRAPSLSLFLPERKKEAFTHEKVKLLLFKNVSHHVNAVKGEVNVLVKKVLLSSWGYKGGDAKRQGGKKDSLD